MCTRTTGIFSEPSSFTLIRAFAVVSITDVEHKIDSHVDICAVRYEGIEREMRGVNARLKRLEGMLIGGAGAIILLLVHLITR